jgi:hypothetical protein
MENKEADEVLKCIVQNYLNNTNIPNETYQSTTTNTNTEEINLTNVSSNDRKKKKKRKYIKWDKDPTLLNLLLENSGKSIGEIKKIENFKKFSNDQIKRGLNFSKKIKDLKYGNVLDNITPKKNFNFQFPTQNSQISTKPIYSPNMLYPTQNSNFQMPTKQVSQIIQTQSIQTPKKPIFSQNIQTQNQEQTTTPPLTDNDMIYFYEEDENDENFVTTDSMEPFNITKENTILKIFPNLCKMKYNYNIKTIEQQIIIKLIPKNNEQLQDSLYNSVLNHYKNFKNLENKNDEDIEIKFNDQVFNKKDFLIGKSNLKEFEVKIGIEKGFKFSCSFNNDSCLILVLKKKKNKETTIEYI